MIKVLVAALMLSGCSSLITQVKPEQKLTGTQVYCSILDDVVPFKPSLATDLETKKKLVYLTLMHTELCINKKEVQHE